MIRTTFHLSITRYQLLLGYVRAWLAQRDPLAIGSLSIVGLIMVLALGRAGVLALLGAYPVMPAAAAAPAPALYILIATPTPALSRTSTPVPTPDALRSDVEALRQRVAELEAIPAAEPQVVYVAQPAAVVDRPQADPPQPTAGPQYQAASMPQEAAPTPPRIYPTFAAPQPGQPREWWQDAELLLEAHERGDK